MRLSEIQSLAAEGGYAGLSFLSQETAACILSAAVWLHREYAWIGDEHNLSESELDEIDELVSTLEYEVMQAAIGTIILNVKKTPTPGTLQCNGLTYLKADYPELYDVLNEEFIISPIEFKVPSMTAKYPAGVSTFGEIGDEGGANSKIFSVSEMPEHPHIYQLPSGIPYLAGEIPVPGVWVGVTPTLPTATTSAGSGAPVNMRSAYIGVVYEIVSGR